MKKYALFTIFLTVFLDILGFGIIIPLLPFYAQKFGANEFVIGLLLASNAVAQFLFNPIWGRVSDKFGRRLVMLVTVLGSAIAYLLFGFANSLFLLFVSRVLAGIAGATVGVAQSCISDITTKEERSKVLGQLGAFFALGFVFGPALSGILSNAKAYIFMGSYIPGIEHLAKYSFQMPGIVAAVLGFINFFMVLFFLPESNQNMESKTEKKAFDWEGFNAAIRHPEMVNLFLIQFIMMFSTSTMFSTFALFLHDKYGYGITESSYMFAYFGVCSAIIQGVIVGKLVKRYSEVKLMIFSSICLTIGLALISYMPGVFYLFLVSTLIFLGNSIMNPCITSMVSQRAKDTQTGVTLGVSQSLGSLARIFGPVWGGYIFYVAGYHYPFITGSVFSFIVVLISLKMLTSQKTSSENAKAEPLPL